MSLPCVEAFIQEHPDFSNNEARGILGLTGYNGILGYRTDDALATSTDNRYAAKYGVFDTAARKRGGSACDRSSEKCRMGICL